MMVAFILMFQKLISLMATSLKKAAQVMVQMVNGMQCLLVAMFFASYKDNPYVIKAFKGIRPVVVALIGVPMIDMLKATKMRWWSWVVWIASMTLVCLLSVSPIYILICVIVVAAFISWYNNRQTTDTHHS